MKTWDSQRIFKRILSRVLWDLAIGITTDHFILHIHITEKLIPYFIVGLPLLIGIEFIGAKRSAASQLKQQQEQKLWLERLQKLGVRLLSGTGYPTPSREAMEVLISGKKIQAIKLYREETGLGLKQSKEAIEQAERELRSCSSIRYTNF